MCQQLQLRQSLAPKAPPLTQAVRSPPLTRSCSPGLGSRCRRSARSTSFSLEMVYRWAAAGCDNPTCSRAINILNFSGDGLCGHLYCEECAEAIKQCVQCENQPLLHGCSAMSRSQTTLVVLVTKL